MKKLVRIAVVGCGRVAQHYKNILSSGVVDGWDMVGVCDIVPERAKEFGEYFNSSWFISFEEMLKRTEPDLVLVLTPSGSHYTHSKLALELGVHVLVEKPPTMLPWQSRQLAELARLNRLLYGVAFQNRLNPAIRCLKEAIDRDRFGKIVTATIRLRWCRYQSYYEDGWHGTWAQDGGVINQQAIHHLDALNWLLGPVDSVCAVSANRLNTLEAEDTLVAAVRFFNGALGTIEATTAARPEDFEASLSVVGERGLALIGGIALNKVETWRFIDVLDSDSQVPVSCSQDVPNGYGLSHGLLLQQVLDALRNGSFTPPVSVEQAISTIDLVHALYKSDEVGGWISVADRPISARLGQKTMENYNYDCRK
jgi:UDP-N-acetyl-2-amino-2-deoxyglucuronate dehydrogenase